MFVILSFYSISLIVPTANYTIGIRVRIGKQKGRERMCPRVCSFVHICECVRSCTVRHPDSFWKPHGIQSAAIDCATHGTSGLRSAPIPFRPRAAQPSTSSPGHYFPLRTGPVTTVSQQMMSPFLRSINVFLPRSDFFHTWIRTYVLFLQCVRRAGCRTECFIGSGSASRVKVQFRFSSAGYK